MKIFFLFTSILLLLAFVGCSSDDHQSDTAMADEYYTCPMHPSVRSDRPGACPVCGMALVKKSAMKEADTNELASLRSVSLSPTQRVLANISVVRAEKKRIAEDIVTTGVVAASESRQSTVSARFRGRIERLFVSFVGQRVSKGDPLFALYSPDLASAQQEYLLALKSPRSGASDQFSDRSSDILRSARERLKRHYGMTDQQINDLAQLGEVPSTVTFYAPLSGTVLQKSVVEGEYIDEGTTLYQLADLSVVWVFLDIYEQNISFVHEGQDVELTTDSFRGRTFSGRVTFVDPVVNPETRTIRIRTEARNGDHRLKPGMFVRGTISILHEPSVIVPSTAVLSLGTRDVVWVEVHANAFEPREITKGITAGNLTQVLGGLREGESVVATGGYLLDSESTLQLSGTSGHEGHGSTVSAAERGDESVFLRVKGSYTPDLIRARKGVPIHIRVYRDEQSSCTEEIVFRDFGVKQHLKAFDTTMVMFTPDRAGTFTFSCGMDMVHGTLIVE